MEALSKEQWRTLNANLREPFPPEDIDFRPGAKSKDETKAAALAYVDARAIMDRLDDLVGADNWSFEPIPLHIDAAGVMALAKGALTIYGVTKYDVGDKSNMDPSKGCASDALKRAAVHFGMGRYLYGLPSEWLELDNKRFKPADIARLRARLPKPKTHTAPAVEPAPVFTSTSREPDATAQAAQLENVRRTVATPEPPKAPPMRQSAPEPPTGRAHTQQPVTFQDFLKLVTELGFTQAEAMKHLGVRSFAGLDLDEALGKLEALAGAGPIADALGMAIEDVEPASEPVSAYPEDVRADGAPDISLPDFLKEVGKLGYKGNGALREIQAKLGIPDLMGVSYSKCLRKLEGLRAGEPRQAAKTAGASKPLPVKTEPGGGENGRKALRRLALEAGIAADEYLPRFAALFGVDYSHDNEAAWTSYLLALRGERIERGEVNKDGSERIPNDLHAISGAPLN